MVRPLLLQRMQRRFAKPLAVLLVLHVIGAAAYRIIGGDQYTLFDGLYMSFITIATIGYAETVGAQWTFNPAPDFPLNGGEMVVVVATPQGRKSLEERFA